MIIKCPKCDTEHPEYFTECPKCNHERFGSPPAPTAEPTFQQTENGNSLTIFDLSFSTFFTPRLIKVVYVLFIILSTIALFIGTTMISAFPRMALNLKIFFSILSLGGYIYSIILLRITCELCLVLFKIERNTRR
jgi:hypothetical protein